MPIFNPSNYAYATPQNDDTLLLRQASSGRIKSVKVSALVNATTPMQIVASIAALQALPVGGIADGSLVVVTGYYDAGDGGGGMFTYNLTSTATEDGGTIIEPDDGDGRWFRSVENDYLNVKWFGAVGDGVTADAVAVLRTITAALTAGTRRVYLPRGTYAMSLPIAVTAPVFIFGEGAASVAYQGYAATIGTTLLWTGGADAFVTFTGINDGGAGMSDIRLLCESTATEAIVIDGCTGMTLRNITAIDFVADGLVLTAGSDRTNSWNSFDQIHLQSSVDGHSCIWLTGDPPNGNSCHNKFGVIKLIHAIGRHAIVLGYCDNNQFDSTFIFRGGGGTGYGVFVDDSEAAAFPVANVFILLEAGDGGWYQPNTVTSVPAIIFGYQLDNGQPVPNLNGTDDLFNISNYGTLAGIREFGSTNGVAGNFGFSGTFPMGATSHTFNLPQTEPDTKYRIDITPYGDLGAWWISNKTATTFTIDVGTPTAGAINFDANLIRTL